MITLQCKESTYSEVDSHSKRVEVLVAVLCKEINISQKEKREIVISARMHDIGKKVIDPDILNKPSKLNEVELENMKKHLKFGYIIAKNMGYSEKICQNILYHHENYDGSGYPYSLQGEEIPLGSRIIRICDSYDAIRSKRPYKEKREHLEAVEEMIRNKANYDEDILNQFLNMDFDTNIIKH